MNQKIKAQAPVCAFSFYLLTTYSFYLFSHDQINQEVFMSITHHQFRPEDFSRVSDFLIAHYLPGNKD